MAKTQPKNGHALRSTAVRSEVTNHSVTGVQSSSRITNMDLRPICPCFRNMTNEVFRNCNNGSTSCTPSANRIPSRTRGTMIKDARPFGCLPADDPFEKLTSPSAETHGIVRTFKFLHALQSQTSDIGRLGIALECKVHAAVSEGSLHLWIPCVGFPPRNPSHFGLVTSRRLALWNR
jgi:hypothetical protein